MKSIIKLIQVFLFLIFSIGYCQGKIDSKFQKKNISIDDYIFSLNGGFSKYYFSNEEYTLMQDYFDQLKISLPSFSYILPITTEYYLNILAISKRSTINFGLNKEFTPKIKNQILKDFENSMVEKEYIVKSPFF